MKQRLDTFLVEHGYYTTRNKARMAIENGDILVDDSSNIKPSLLVDLSSKITILKSSIPYVSRGGLKLEKALKVFNIEVKDKNCLDIGASSGGFSDCLYQNGAKVIYAIDVGNNQLDPSLKVIPEIISLENTNFRDINIEEYKSKNLEIITCDVSFISLTYIFENVSKILDNNGVFIALIKPQFEVIKKYHNKNGVVKDKKLHLTIIKNLMESANNYNLYLNSLSYSPIKGEKSGNIEYLGLFSFTPKNINLMKINDIIELAHKELR